MPPPNWFHKRRSNPAPETSPQPGGPPPAQDVGGPPAARGAVAGCLAAFVRDSGFAEALFDRDMCYVAASPAWIADYGLGARDFLGTCHYDLFPGQPAEWREAHARAMAGESLSGECDRPEPLADSADWVEWEARPWRGPDGMIGGITLRVRKRELDGDSLQSLGLSKEALERSEARRRILLENASDGIGLVRIDNTVVYCNRSLERIFGAARVGLAGRKLTDFVSAEDARLIELENKRLMRGERTSYELRLDGPDGLRLIRVNAAPCEDDDGNLASLGIYSDNTELFRAQTALLQELAFLSEMEALGREIIGTADPVEIGRTICNAGVAHLRADWAGLLYLRAPRDRDWDFATPCEWLRPEEQARQLLLAAGIVQEVSEKRWRWTCADLAAEDNLHRQALHARWGARSIAAAPCCVGDQPVGVLVVLWKSVVELEDEDLARLGHLSIEAAAALRQCHLIAQIRSANAELEQTIERLRVAEHERERFYRFLVHDLNKPLAAIIGTASRLASHEQLEDRLAARAQRIESAALRLRDIVAQLLEYERIQRGEFTINYEVVDIRTAVREAAAVVGLAEGEVELAVDGDPLDAPAPAPDPDYDIVTDPVQAGRVLQNLLDNAHKYATSRIHVASRPVPGGVEVTVANDGRILSDSELSRVFNEFYRVSGQLQAGLGIGLAAVRSLVHRLGGDIHAAAEHGGGVRFTVNLPKTPPRFADMAARAPRDEQ